MRPVAKARETERVMYDHYRHKVANLEEAVKTDQTKQQKYQRNLSKLGEAKRRFEEQQRKLDGIID